MVLVYEEMLMRVMRKFVIFVAAFAMSASGGFAQPAAQSGQQIPVTVTVTTTGKDQTVPPAVAINSVVAKQDGKVAKIVSWEPASGGKAGLTWQF